MPKVSLEQIKELPHDKLLKAIDRAKKRLKTNEVVQNMFKEFDVDIDELDDVPVCFADLPVSARTEHGIIYLNYNLLADGDFDKDDHYLVHELTHYLQQTTGTKPTKGSTDDDYLDNKFEQEGFQNQTEYLSDTRGDGAAEAYTDKVLNHHEVPKSEREERKKELMHLAMAAKNPDQLVLFPKKKKRQDPLDKTKKELDQEYDEAIARGPQESHARPPIKKMHPLDQVERMRKLKELLSKLKG